MIPTSLDESVRQSDFVFNGRVVETHATTLPTLEATDSTVVVQVDEVVRAPAAFTGLAGQRITVSLRDPGSMPQGEQATFFAEGVLFGDSIAVQEVEHRPIEAEATALRGQVAATIERIEEDEIRARAASADAVVVGRVSHVRLSPAAAAADPTQPGPLSEHDPQWREAVIDVEGVLKGPAPQEPVIVLYPASIDVMWVKAPKFHAGQEGVWFLHAEEVPQRAASVFPSVYTALDPHDFQHRQGEERMRSLLEDVSD